MCFSVILHVDHSITFSHNFSVDPSRECIIPTWVITPKSEKFQNEGRSRYWVISILGLDPDECLRGISFLHTSHAKVGCVWDVPPGLVVSWRDVPHVHMDTYFPWFHDVKLTLATYLPPCLEPWQNIGFRRGCIWSWSTPRAMLRFRLRSSVHAFDFDWHGHETRYTLHNHFLEIEDREYSEVEVEVVLQHRSWSVRGPIWVWVGWQHQFNHIVSIAVKINTRTITSRFYSSSSIFPLCTLNYYF